MNALEIYDQIRNEELVSGLPYEINDIYEESGYSVINSKVPIRISHIASSIARSGALSIFDETNTEIGVLLFLKNEAIEITSFSEYQFVAFWDDLDASELNLSEKHYFSSDYAVIDSIYLHDYLNKYFNCSGLWGGFIHEKMYSYSDVSNRHTIVLPALTAYSLSRFNNLYYDTVIRGVCQAFAFERFLKLYHLIEVNFDFELINQIKALDINTEIHKIGDLLWRQERKDFDRLIYIYEQYCSDVTTIISRINTIRNFLPIAEKLLFIFGKSENPVKSFVDFSTIALMADGFTDANCIRVRSGANHEKFIGKLAMYIVYRIRNSIAHYKVGEYLMSPADETFVAEFGEPLLKAIIVQIYK